jgi:hypothetical protein
MAKGCGHERMHSETVARCKEVNTEVEESTALEDWWRHSRLRVVKLLIHLNLFASSRKAQIYCQSHICVHGIVIN